MIARAVRSGVVFEDSKQVMMGLGEVGEGGGWRLGLGREGWGGGPASYFR